MLLSLRPSFPLPPRVLKSILDVYIFMLALQLGSWLLFKKIFFTLYLFIYLFLAVLGLRFCAWAFSSCGEWGPLVIAAWLLLIVNLTGLKDAWIAGKTLFLGVSVRVSQEEISV